MKIEMDGHLEKLITDLCRETDRLDKANDDLRCLNLPPGQLQDAARKAGTAEKTICAVAWDIREYIEGQQ